MTDEIAAFKFNRWRHSIEVRVLITFNEMPMAFVFDLSD